MKKYYICITPFFPSSNDWRGAYVLDQVKAIRRNSDYDVIVFRPCSLTKIQDSYSIDGINVYHVPSWFTPSYFFNGFGSELNGLCFVKKIRELGIDFADIAVAHAHTAAFSGYITALKKRCKAIKTIIQYHDLDPYQIKNGMFARWRPNVIYRVKKFTSQFKYIDLHLCISRRTQYNLYNFPIPHPQESFQPYIEALRAAHDITVPKGMHSYVLYNGVDTSVFHRLGEEKDKSYFKIGCIANFQSLKDHMTLIKAIEIIVNRNPDLKLKVSFVGSGETKEECLGYITNKGLLRYFAFEQEVSHEQLVKYYNSLDLFVLPSTFEGFGCVYTEAAACGVPFMGCTGQGYSEYVSESDYGKWLINPHDYNGLAQIIYQQMDNPQRQELIKPFDIDLLISEYLDYIEKKL